MATARDRLLARRSQLVHGYRQAEALADEVTSEREIEALDTASEQWDANVLSHLGEVEKRQLTEVMAALRRVSDGTYGKCVRCEARISPGRLDAMPEAAMCSDCATYVEQRHRR